ncbi:MAG: hypothetical protein KGL39_49345 [Patescibacteria group bacterium]|nr:hypothetical protein [Patescibacteria group bacterium]
MKLSVLHLTPPVKQPNPLPELLPGDILLYGGGFIGALIQFRTWSDISHCEVYLGQGRSAASRSDGPGVFPLRILGLRRVLRPVKPFDLSRGLRWLASVDGLPYGYADLLRFYLIDVPTKGLICSQFLDLFFQNCGLWLFNPQYPEGAVCPRDYDTLAPSLVNQIWSWK